MGLFGKKKADPVEALKQQVSVPTQGAGNQPSFSSFNQPAHKEVDLVEQIKSELTSCTRDLIKQSKRKLQEIDKQLGKIEARVHNIKIYEGPLKDKAAEIEGKLLTMRGGEPEKSREDLSQDEFDVISFLKENDRHVGLMIKNIRDLRHYIELVLEHPLEIPFEDQEDVAKKADLLVEKLHEDVALMHKHFSHIYDLEEEVHSVAQEHDVKFDAAAAKDQPTAK